MVDSLLQQLCGQKIMHENDIWGTVLQEGYKRPHGLAHQLARASYEALNGESGEIDLIVSILIRAGKDRDYDFLSSGEFDYYVELIGLNPKVVRAIFTKVLNYLDRGIGNLDEEFLSGAL